MTLDELIAIEEIKRLKYRYLRAIDTQDWPLLRTTFADDARTWYTGGTFVLEGADHIVASLGAMLTESFVSSHIAVHPEITLTGPATAVGWWRMEESVHQSGEERRGAAYYRDEYVKVGGDWKIRGTGYTPIYVRTVTASGDVTLTVDPARGVRERATD